MNDARRHSVEKAVEPERDAATRPRRRAVRHVDSPKATAVAMPPEVTDDGGRPVGHVIGHQVGEPLPYPRLERPVERVHGRARGTVPAEAAEALDRPVGHVEGHRPGEAPTPVLGYRPVGHVLGPVTGVRPH